MCDGSAVHGLVVGDGNGCDGVSEDIHVVCFIRVAPGRER